MSPFGNPPVYPTRPFLAYTRQRGWVVAEPCTAQQREDYGDVGVIRPGRGVLREREVLAIAELPPVPDAAA